MSNNIVIVCICMMNEESEMILSAFKIKTK